jgi:hypothetical protein
VRRLAVSARKRAIRLSISRKANPRCSCATAAWDASSESMELRRVDFDGIIHQLGGPALDDLTLAYTITAHKARGLSFRQVVIPVREAAAGPVAPTSFRMPTSSRAVCKGKREARPLTLSSLAPFESSWLHGIQGRFPAAQACLFTLAAVARWPRRWLFADEPTIRPFGTSASL